MEILKDALEIHGIVNLLGHFQSVLHVVGADYYGDLELDYRGEMGCMAASQGGNDKIYTGSHSLILPGWPLLA